MIYIKKQTAFFKKWVENLPPNVVSKIEDYIARVLDGNFSNIKSVGGGVSEIKINYQKGYRIYFTNISGAIVLLLLGGDKSTQSKDILKAKKIKSFLSEEIK